MAKTLSTAIDVMRAADRGEEIEYRKYGTARWHSMVQDSTAMSWNWLDFDYRVKPKPQKFWVLFDAKGKVMASGTGDPSIMRNSEWKLEWYERTAQ